MADTRLSDLSAAASVAGTDIVYVVQTPGAGGVKATVSQLGGAITAADSAKLGGTAAASYLLASDAFATYQTQAAMSGYLTTSGTAADSSKFGGQLPAYYQVALVSATNIKTVNGSSILGSGDLTVSGGATLAEARKVASLRL